MTELDVLDLLEKTSGKTDKQNILKKNISDKMADLLDATFNFKRKFYIKKYDVRYPRSGNSGCKHDEFMLLLAALESEVHRGDAARNIVESFFMRCTPQQAHWYNRVIGKSLKAGFSLSTANKTGYKIPEFKVMLAKDGKKSPKAAEMVHKGGYVSIKLDGYRCLAIIEDGEVELLSRNGTIYENFPSVVVSLADAFPVGKWVFDGEIMSDDFQSMQKTAFAAKKGRTVGDVKYHIFDCIDYDEWKASKFKIKKSKRIDILTSLSHIINAYKNLNIVSHDWVSGPTAMKQITKLESKYIAQGFEGAMFLPDVPYYLGRKSNKLMKFKTMLSQECVITGFYEGKAGTKYEGTMGGVYVVQENGKDCKCGSGFSDEDRDYMWANQEEFLTKMFEAKFQEETPDGIMRFPVFFRWRSYKNNKE